MESGYTEIRITRRAIQRYVEPKPEPRIHLRYQELEFIPAVLVIFAIAYMMFGGR